VGLPEGSCVGAAEGVFVGLPLGKCVGVCVGLELGCSVDGNGDGAPVDGNGVGTKDGPSSSVLLPLPLPGSVF
jgi:hypothetical protein